MCAEPIPCAGLPVYLDTVPCAVFALLSFLLCPFLVFLGFFCLGLVWFLFLLLCSKHEVLSTGPLNCGVEAYICVIFGG